MSYVKNKECDEAHSQLHKLNSAPLGSDRSQPIALSDKDSKSSPSTPTPKVSCFTTCMGRRHHLEQTLRRNLEWNKDYQNAEFVLLDYNSGDRLGDWIRDEMWEYIQSGLLVYYRYEESDFFKYSHSRNLAARLCRGEIICNLDADNFTGQDFLFYIEEQMETTDFLVGCEFDGKKFSPIERIEGDYGTTGRMAVRRQHFLEAGGYDESMVAWGYEDMDLFHRISLAGFNCQSIDHRFLDCIVHGDEERIANTEEKYIGRGGAAEDGSLVRHIGVSKNNIAQGKLVANQGNFGCGNVVKNFTGEQLSLTPIHVSDQNP
ncbi:MAG: glycosyltransferase [Gammaproteobacteria bacterium]|nr:glycosyltransferase [Gammaproteobacteria bacterium]